MPQGTTKSLVYSICIPKKSLLSLILPPDEPGARCSSRTEPASKKRVSGWEGEGGGKGGRVGGWVGEVWEVGRH